MIVVGSRNLQTFDAALVIYTFAVIFATWGVLYHYNVWLDKAADPNVLAARLATVPRERHRRCSASAWAHGTPTGGAAIHPATVDVPLADPSVSVLGLPAGHGDYVSFGLRLDLFPHAGRSDDVCDVCVRLSRDELPPREPHGPNCFFTAIDISAFLVLAGIGMALWRRLRERGPQATQTFVMDFFPLCCCLPSP